MRLNKVLRRSTATGFIFSLLVGCSLDHAAPRNFSPMVKDSASFPYSLFDAINADGSDVAIVSDGGNGGYFDANDASDVRPECGTVQCTRNDVVPIDVTDVVWNDVSDVSDVVSHVS